MNGTPHDPIRDALGSFDGRVLFSSVLGTTDHARVRRELDEFCASFLGSGVESVAGCEISVGAAFALFLRDGRNVMVKAHHSRVETRFLRAVHRVQRRLFERGFPCPRPLSGPRRFGRTLATAETFVDDGEPDDAHRPEIRRSMAAALAWQIKASGKVEGAESMPVGWERVKGSLWPEPHNALFDFEATADGAEWIDEIAREARSFVDTLPGEEVVGHFDWSAKHFRFDGDEIRVVYDWDSLRREKEPVVLGAAAATFPATWYMEISNLAPTPNETRSFVSEYETARGEPFSHAERAAAMYSMAYSARCEHALSPNGENLRGGFREALAEYGDAYLAV